MSDVGVDGQIDIGPTHVHCMLNLNSTFPRHRPPRHRCCVVFRPVRGDEHDRERRVRRHQCPQPEFGHAMTPTLTVASCTKGMRDGCGECTWNVQSHRRGRATSRRTHTYRYLVGPPRRSWYSARHQEAPKARAESMPVSRAVSVRTRRRGQRVSVRAERTNKHHAEGPRASGQQRRMTEVGAIRRDSDFQATAGGSRLEGT